MKLNTVIVAGLLATVEAKTYRRQDALNNKNFWKANGCDHLAGHYMWNHPPYDPSMSRDEAGRLSCHTVPYIQTRLLCYKGCLEGEKAFNTQVRKQILEPCHGILTKEMVDQMLVNATEIQEEPKNATAVLYTPVPFDYEHWYEEYEEGLPYYVNLDYATWYGVALLAYWCMIFGFGVFFNFSQKVFFSIFKNVRAHSIRRHISLPALFGYKHAQPMGWDPLKMVAPTRVQSLVVLGYLIMAFVLCFPSYPFVDDYEEAGTWGTQLESFLSDRTGIMSFTQIPIVFLFGGRNNFLMWLTGWSFDTFNVYHRWTSRVMMLYAILHSIIWTWRCRDTLASEAALLYWTMGVLATTAGGVMLFQAMQFFRTRWYETFLIIHIVLGILFVAGIWWHCWTIGWMQWVYATIAVWGFDRILRVVKIVISGGIQTGEFVVVDNEQLIIKAELEYSRAWKIFPGSHVYIYFLSGNKFWESHPFTVYQSPVAMKTGKMSLVLKAKDGLTFDIATRIIAAGGSRHMKVLIEGPYGSEHPVGKYDTSVYIAGGIGITATYSYAQKVVANSVSKNIIFTWITRGESCMTWFGPELDYLLADPRVQVNMYITQTTKAEGESEEDGKSSDEKAVSLSMSDRNNLSINYFRPEMSELVPEYLAQSQGTTAVVVCGPPVLNDDIRKALCDNIESKQDRVDYFEESFSW